MRRSSVLLSHAKRLSALVSLFAAAGYGTTARGQGTAWKAAAVPAAVTKTASAPAPDTVVFAGGCFWSMQKMFDHVPGVVSTLAGYAGGKVANPSYEDVETGNTGHAESVQVVYDPAKLSYSALLNAYWHSIDPTDGEGTFCDRGPQYRPLIFVRDVTHRQVADSSKAVVAALFKKPIAVQIVAATPFYAAEEYHQEYYKKNPEHYNAYRLGCGRDKALEKAWAGVKGG